MKNKTSAHCPRISVLIPVYNDRLYLSDALQSIRLQTFTDWECICINDGSTDESEAIIDRFVQDDPRFFKLNKANGGVSSARNAGLQIARGEYLFFMDHDDLIPGHTLAHLLEAVEKFDADFSRGQKQMVAEDFKLEELPNNSAQLLPEMHCYDTKLYNFPKYTRGKYRLWCNIWLCLFRRSVIEDIRFAEDIRAGGEDNLYMYNVIAKIKKYVQIDEITLCHRYSKTSVTLNGYNPLLMKTVEVRIPYIFTHFATTARVDKRLVQWIYRSEAHDAYRILIARPIRANREEVFALSTEILQKLTSTPAFDKIREYWNVWQNLNCRLFMARRFRLLRLVKSGDYCYHKLFRSN